MRWVNRYSGGCLRLWERSLGWQLRHALPLLNCPVQPGVSFAVLHLAYTETCSFIAMTGRRKDLASPQAWQIKRRRPPHLLVLGFVFLHVAAQAVSVLRLAVIVLLRCS